MALRTGHPRTRQLFLSERPHSVAWQGCLLPIAVVGRQEASAEVDLELLGAVLGSLGDLCRATSGERETEPKQIGEGTPDSTKRHDSPAKFSRHSASGCRSAL